MDLSVLSACLPRWLTHIFARPHFSPQEYWESRHRSHAGNIAAVGHAQLSDAENLEQYEIKQIQLREVLGRHFPKASGCKLLDAGCGIGALTKLYVELGFEVTGVDFSAAAISAARNSGIPAVFHQAALHRLSLNRAFDAVCVIDVLQHVVDDDTFAQAVSAVGKHLKIDCIAVVIDSMSASGPTASHCRRRSFQQHEAEFRIAGLEAIEHSQFTLPHENSTKDLVVFGRRF